MTPDRLLAHFGQLSEAPNSVFRLRQFILELAVRGKLVDQDPTDAIATALLKTSQAPADGDVAYPVPANWIWLQVGEVATSRLGKMLDRGKNKGTPCRYLRNVNVRWFDFDLTDVLEMRFEDAEREVFALRQGDVLVCEGGEPGRAAVWDEREPGILFQKALHRVRLMPAVNPHYFVNVLRESATSGRLAARFTGVGIKHLTGQVLASVLIPIPPLAEQHRIVARIDELMALCDQLEAAQKEREQRRDRLVAASLHRLTNGSDPETAREDARFHLAHLPRLTTRPEHIQQLRRAIVNVAIRGLLVPQDHNDESAADLLTRLQAESGQSASQTASKRRMSGGVRPAFVPPFSIPETWQWVSLNQVAQEFRYGTSAKCSYEPDGEPVLRIPNIRGGRIDLQDLKYGPLTPREAAELRLRCGDILMVRSNGSLSLVGRPALVEQSAAGYCYAGYLVRVRRSVTHLHAPFILLALSSDDVRQQIELPVRSTVGLKNVNATELGALTFPLPPLAEQRRIVARVDELMALCDQLEAQITITAQDSRRLLEAVLHEALSGAD